jgi:hypothetical protein
MFPATLVGTRCYHVVCYKHGEYCQVRRAKSTRTGLKFWCFGCGRYVLPDEHHFFRTYRIERVPNNIDELKKPYND